MALGRGMNRGMEKLHNEEISLFVSFSKSYEVDKMKESGMGRACGKHGRGGKCLQYFCLKCLMETLT